MIIITGIGRSGTSFTAKLLMEAGADFKGDWFNENIRAGMELRELKDINLEIMLGKSSSVRDAINKLDIADADKLFAPGAIFKDPRFVLTIREWLESGFKIEHIVYCSRPYEEVYLSSMRTGRGLAGDSTDGIIITSYEGFRMFSSYVEKNFLWMLKQHDVPLTIISFPKSASDFTEASKLSAFVDIDRLRSAWEKIRRPEQIDAKDQDIADTAERKIIQDLQEKNYILGKRDEELRQKNEKLRKITGQIEQLYASNSWKITAPLRLLGSILRGKGK